MLMRLCCTFAVIGSLLVPVSAWANSPSLEKPSPFKLDKPKPAAEEPKDEPVQGFFQTGPQFTQPDWALTPGGIHPGFQPTRMDTMSGFNYPGSTGNAESASQCPVARAAARAGISVEAMQQMMMQQHMAQQQMMMQQMAYSQMVAMASMSYAMSQMQRSGTGSANMRNVPGFNPQLASRFMSSFNPDCFAAGTSVQLADRESSIESIAVGMRVRSDRSADVVDAAALRKVELRATQLDGRRTDIVLLRSQEWLQENGVKAGALLTVDIPGCGFQRLVEVRSVEPCPAMATGQGPIVTGTFRHESTAIVDLYVEGQADPIGTSAHHLFWSLDRESFVRADELRPGDQLRGQNGSVTVVRRENRTVAEPVYNLEVQGRDEYNVSPLGVRVRGTGRIRVIR